MGLINEENDEQIVERLAGKAGNIIAMLRSVFTTPEGLDIATAIILRRALQAMPVTKQSVRNRHKCIGQLEDELEGIFPGITFHIEAALDE